MPVTTLTAYIFPNPATAPRLARRLEPLRERGLGVRDAAVVQWALDQPQPSAWQTESINDRQALSGAFWGLLFAHLFLLPLSHHQPAHQTLEGDRTLAHLGIGPTQLHSIRGLVTPGSSALFTVTDGHPGTGAAADRLAIAIDKVFPTAGDTERRATAIALSPAQTQRLYAGFGRHPQLNAEPMSTGGGHQR